MLFAGFHAAQELVNGGGLVASRLIAAAQLEIHERSLLLARWRLVKPSLYAAAQIAKRSPSVTTGARRPSAQAATNHGDLSGVIAVVNQCLPQNGPQGGRHFRVPGMCGLYFTS
jgi:hypothetical protein